MLKSPRPEDAALDARLRDEALRDRPEFDAMLHERTMASLRESRPLRHDASSPLRLHWLRYAGAAALVLICGIGGSGWLRHHLHQRMLRRDAVASLAGVFDAAMRSTPPRFLDTADALAAGQWMQLDQDVRRETDQVRGHWAWGLLLEGQVPESSAPSEKNPQIRTPAGI